MHNGGKKFSKLIRSGTAVTTYEKAIEKLDKCFVKAANTDFDSFVNRLRVLLTNCSFNDAEAEIRTQIIHGCVSDTLRIKALAEN